MEELRVRWELPSIAHFVNSFHKVLSLQELHVEELETAFLTSCTSEGSDLLNTLIANLLSGFYNSKNIEFYNYESALRDFLHQKWQVEQEKTNPLVSSEFQSLSLSEKLDIVYSLCNARLDADDVPEAAKALNGEDLRLEPVGQDAEGYTYWNFNDERLYREKLTDTTEYSSKRKKKHKEKKRKGKHRERVEESWLEVPNTVSSDWSLVCSAEEEWKDFCKKLKKSHQKQDKRLRKIIVNDFLPLIPEIIAEKEKAIKKRLLEMLPKRESGRLARKRAEMDEQRMLMAKLEAEEREEERAREAEKKRLAEERRKQELAREREERQKARELERQAKDQARQERAMRALMREHRVANKDFEGSADSEENSSSYEEDSDFEEYGTKPRLYSSSGRRTTSRQRSKPARPSNKSFGAREYEKINRILYQIQRDKNCWPFLEPVTTEIAPDYFDVIEKPMDISVMRAKSNRKEYSSKKAFVDDFELIVQNCAKYNGSSSDFGMMASRLKEKFDVLIDRAFPASQTIRSHTIEHNVTEDSSAQDSADSQLSVDADDVEYSTESSSEEGSVYDDDAASDDSYHVSNRQKHNPSRPQRKKNTTNRNKQRAAAKKRNASTSEETEQSSSEDDDSNGVNNFHCARSDSSDGPAGRVFGIARRTSSSAHQILCNNIDMLTGGVTSPVLGSTNGNSTRDASPSLISNSDLLSPTSTTQSKQLDRSRWMSPPDTNSFPTNKSSTNHTAGSATTHNSSNQNSLQSRAHQPFQGLVAQLKRTTSLDPTSDVPTKRLC